MDICHYGPKTTNNFFYILNPDGSTKDIEVVLSPLLKKYNLKNGVIGKKDTKELIETFKEGLANNEIFLYCGHDAGEQYIPREEIRNISKCKVALLMGCSSVLLDTNGDFEPSGSVLAYVLSDCYATVGNLWIVTDKDLNVCTYELVDKWISSETSLSNCLPIARKNCKLRFLNGAALIYYGLPNVFLQNQK